MSDKDSRYQVDHESLAGRRCQNDITSFLTEQTASKNFDLRRVCDNCVGWTPSRGLSKKPLKPFANSDFDSCSGCAYSYLDQVKPDKEEERPNLPRRRVRTWKSKNDGHQKKQRAESVKLTAKGPATSKGHRKGGKQKRGR